jgi:hypothetical protein
VKEFFIEDRCSEYSSVYWKLIPEIQRELFSKLDVVPCVNEGEIDTLIGLSVWL